MIRNVLTISVIYRSLDGCHGNSNGQFMAPFLANNHSNRLHMSWDEIVSDHVMILMIQCAIGAIGHSNIRSISFEPG